jgi:hypothetical protein
VTQAKQTGWTVEVAAVQNLAAAPSYSTTSGAGNIFGQLLTSVAPAR